MGVWRGTNGGAYDGGIVRSSAGGLMLSSGAVVLPSFLLHRPVLLTPSQLMLPPGQTPLHLPPTALSTSRFDLALLKGMFAAFQTP